MSDLTRRHFLEVALAFSANAIAGPRAFAEGTAALSYEDYSSHDAIGLAELVASGEASSAELLEAAIARTEDVDPAINAVVLRHFERARATLERLPTGPFRGVPFLLKDLFTSLEGSVTTEGSRFFADAVASSTDLLTSRYQAAGLVIFGKTASPEFGAAGTTESAPWGDTHNPWKRGYSAGGSSGGAAAAVAAGIVPAAHASDGGGSIRIPASACGVFGLKPTRGRVPSGDGIDRSAGLAIDHVVSRSVRDSAALLDATSAPVPGLSSLVRSPRRPFLEEVRAEPGALRIGLQTESFMVADVHPDCRRAATEAAKLCETLGHHLAPIDPPPLSAEDVFRSYSISLSAATTNHVLARSRALARSPTSEDLEPHNLASHRQSLSVTAADFEAAYHATRRHGQLIVEHQRDFDIILSPTLGGPPRKHGALRGDYETYMRASMECAAFTLQYNISGQPAMSVPLHWNTAGLPIGVMFVAPLGREDVLLRLAAQLEAAAPWGSKRPRVEGIARA